MNYLQTAKETLDLYTQEIDRLKQRLSDEFNQAVELMLHCVGRVVVAGIGKSGLVGKKNGGNLRFHGHTEFFLASDRSIPR